MKPINSQISAKLLQLAKNAAQNAYAPYSKFKVGAALITNDGSYYTGCNVENVSYGLTLCAERNAISTMIANGHEEFNAIAIYSPNSTECYPCGACRQWLYEFGPNASVYVLQEGNRLLETTVEELLPNAFGPNKLL